MLKRSSFLVIFLSCIIFSCSLSWGQNLMKPLTGLTFCIDPGQGGELYSATDKKEVVTKEFADFEATVNLRIALFLRSYLEDAGARVVLTREKSLNDSLDPQTKAALATQANAHYFIGIHHAYNPDTSLDYISVYTRRNSPPETISLANAIIKHLSMQLDVVERGLLSDGLEIFNYTTIPTIIITPGFITNKQFRRSEEKMQFVHSIAMGIFKGILNYFNAYQVAGAKPPESTPLPALSTLPALTPSPPATPVLGLKPLTSIQPVQPTPLPPIVTPTLTPLAPVLKPITEPTLPSLVSVVTPSPPALKPISETSQVDMTPIPRALPSAVIEPQEEFKPLFLRPVDAVADQSWLFGETWGSWPVKKGISFNALAGSSVKAVADGVIVESDSSGKSDSISPYANYVLIKHDTQVNNKDVYTLYGQLRDIAVKKDDKVKAGDEIGKTGMPYSQAQTRDTEFEFEVRLGGLSQDFVQNPEMFIPLYDSKYGCIVGRFADNANRLIPSLQIDGAMKSDDFAPYQFSLTYGPGVNPTEKWNENFVICDVLTGEHVLSAENLTQKILVKSGMVTYVELRQK